MTPITERDQLSSELIYACMEANYDRALDARYCINDETLWGAYMHPLRFTSREAISFGVQASR